MKARDLTRDGLVRALGDLAARPAVDGAVKASAERVADRIAARGVSAAVRRRGAGDQVVTATGPGLFTREFGGVDRASDPVVGPVLDGLRRRR